MNLNSNISFDMYQIFVVGWCIVAIKILNKLNMGFNVNIGLRRLIVSYL